MYLKCSCLSIKGQIVFFQDNYTSILRQFLFFRVWSVSRRGLRGTPAMTPWALFLSFSEGDEDNPRFREDYASRWHDGALSGGCHEAKLFEPALRLTV